MSDHRDRQDNTPDRGPQAAVENLNPTYGVNNAVDGAGAGPGNYGARELDGRGEQHVYSRPTAGRIWDDGREIQGNNGSPSHVLSGHPDPNAYYTHSRGSNGPPPAIRHDDFLPHTHVERRELQSSILGGSSSIPGYYGESSSSYQHPSVQIRPASARAPPYDYSQTPYETPPPPPPDPIMTTTPPIAHARSPPYPRDPYYQNHPHQHPPLTSTDRYGTFSPSYLDLPPPSAYPHHQNQHPHPHPSHSHPHSQHSAHPHPHPHPNHSPSQQAYQPLVRDPYPAQGAGPSYAYSDPLAYHAHEGGTAFKERRTSLDSSIANKKPVVVSRLGLDPAAKQERRREQNRMAQRAFRARAKVREQETSGSVDDEPENEVSFASQ